MNPLMSSAPAQPMAAPAQNPLAQQQQAPMSGVAGAMGHPMAQNMSPEDLQQHIDSGSYNAAALGALTKKPDLKPKDVVNTVADSVAAGKSTTEDAVKFLASMPQKPDELRAWLQQQYLARMTGAVALHGMAQKVGMR